MVLKNLADQDWFGFNFTGQDWTRTEKFHIRSSLEQTLVWMFVIAFVMQAAAEEREKRTLVPKLKQFRMIRAGTEPGAKMLGCWSRSQQWNLVSGVKQNFWLHAICAMRTCMSDILHIKYAEKTDD